MLPTDYQTYIHASRYARFRDDLGRREHWDETVTRYFDYFEEDLERRHGYKVPPTLRSELYDAVSGLHVMTSMRALMTAGEAARRENLAIYNCAYVAIDRPRVFAEILYILMCGTGVGFSVERQYINSLPEVPSDFSQTAFDIIVGDSKRGWAEAFETLLTCLYAGTVPHIIYDEIRPAGARLKVFGGRASGPEPLQRLFEFTIRTFRNAAGRKLNSLECHEIATMTGDIVVVGGVRRSAEISLSNLSDQRMRDAKSGDWRSVKPHLELANNSVAYTETPDVGAFMTEWLSIFKSMSGERGMFNRIGAQRKVLRGGRRDHRHDFGVNPCVTGDTPLLTKRGYRPIRELEGVETEVWNGREWSQVVPFSTGVNPLVEVKLSDGTSLRCTPYHHFVVQDAYRSEPYKLAARDLMEGQKLAKFDMPTVEYGADPEGDAYSQGFYQGDGNDGYTWSWVYEPKLPCASRLQGEVGDVLTYGRVRWKHGAMLAKDFVPHGATLRYRRDWLAGLLDADGCVVRDKGDALQLSSSNLAFLEELRLMLTTMGVQAKISAGHPDGRVGSHPNFVGYASKASYRLCINQADTSRLVQSVGVVFERLQVSGKSPQRDARRFVAVEAVTPLDHCEETFCVTEPKNGTATFAGIVTGNCGEIILRSRGLCNLSEAVVRESDGMAELREKVRLASILGTWQATQTTFQFVEPDWAANAEEERLLGVSLTGIYDNAFMRGDTGFGKLARGLHDLRATVVATNRELSYEIGIAPSVATTTVKPSGTVSQLVNSPSGIHQGHAPYYIRRVASDNKDPVTQFMADAGIPHEPHASKPDAMTVFSFPIALSPRTVTREDVTAIQHLELAKLYNQNWSEHAVSCTISIKENEWPAVGGWVYDNFDNLVGMSFLPYFGEDTTYTQLPYETIDKRRYDDMLAAMPASIDWTKLADYEQGEDSVTGTREFACQGNSCEIVDSVKPL